MTPLAWITFIWLGLLVGAVTQAILSRARCLPQASLVGERVLLVRPCAGLEPRLLANLLSLQHASFSFTPVVRLSVSRADDPAAEVAKQAAGTLRRAGIEAEFVVSPAFGRNHKTCQLGLHRPVNRSRVGVGIVKAPAQLARNCRLCGAAGNP